MLSPAELFDTIVEAIRRLFTTPIAGWTWGQWFLAIILLSLVSSCCGGSACFLCRRGGGRRRRRRNNNSRRRDGDDLARGNPGLGGNDDPFLGFSVKDTRNEFLGGGHDASEALGLVAV